MVSFAGERRLKAIPSSKVTGDKTLLSENSLLRDQVEKERFRRKVCDDQSFISHHIFQPICQAEEVMIVKVVLN